MSKFDYEYVRTVRAAQWLGDNLEEMKELLKDSVYSNEFDGPEVYTEDIEAMFGYGGYTMLKFYAWEDDQEVDPGQWVVVYDDGEYGEILQDGEFTSMFRKRA
jgi:hypothetical protein